MNRGLKLLQATGVLVSDGEGERVDPKLVDFVCGAIYPVIDGMDVPAAAVRGAAEAAVWTVVDQIIAGAK